MPDTKPGMKPEMAAEDVQAELDSWDVEVGQELQSESPFLGQIMADEKVPGKYGPQWHIAVKPLHFALRGKTGMFHEHYSRSTQLRSKMGAMLASITEHRIVPPETKVGLGQLIGTVAWFVKRDLNFGKSANGEQITSEGVIIIYSAATEDEQMLRDHFPDLPAGVTAAQSQQAPAAPEWDDDQMEAVVAVIEGLDQRGAQAAAMGRTHAASKLPRELRQAVMNGTAIPTLVAAGKVVIDDENGGVITRTGQAPAPELVGAAVAQDDEPAF